MRPYLVGLAAMLAALGGIAQGQEAAPLSDKYSGGYVTQTRTGNTTRVGVELTILQVEGTKVTATLKRFAPPACSGEFPMAGSIKDDTLTLRSTEKAGASGDCSFSLSAKREGNKLIGTALGNRPLELSK